MVSIAPSYVASQLIFMVINLALFVGFLVAWLQEQDEQEDPDSEPVSVHPTKSKHSHHSDGSKSPAHVRQESDPHSSPRLKSSRQRTRSGFVRRSHRLGWLCVLCNLILCLDPQGVLGVWPLALTDLLINIPTCALMAAAWEALQAVAISVACTKRLMNTQAAQSFIKTFRIVKISASAVAVTFTFIRFVITLAKPEEKYSQAVWLFVVGVIVFMVTSWFLFSSRRFVATIQAHIASTNSAPGPGGAAPKENQTFKGDGKMQAAIANLKRLQIACLIIMILDPPLLLFMGLNTIANGYPRADPYDYSINTMVFAWVIVLLEIIVLWVTWLRRIQGSTQHEVEETTSV